MKRLYRVLQSPVTVLVLILVMGVTLGTSLVASSRSSANAERIAQQAQNRSKDNLQRAQINAANNEKTRLSICGLAEPFLKAYETTPPERQNTELAISLKVGLIQARTAAECTPDLTDLK